MKEDMNGVWTSWLSPEHLPARATIGVADLGPRVLIEVVVAARQGGDARSEHRLDRCG